MHMLLSLKHMLVLCSWPTEGSNRIGVLLPCTVLTC